MKFHGVNALSPTPDPLEGIVLDGTHRIDGLLNQGGMAAVYQGTQLRLGKRVAIKVISHELAANPEALERFRREARVTSALGHPNIVQVSDFSTMPTGEPCLVMEFLEGEDLYNRLRRVRHLPAGEVARIVRQVASALAAAHAKGIIHRDLKPGNIYLVEVPGEPDFVKVLDFGISKVRSEPSRITDALSLLGTPFYMSPEQALGQTEDVDESTDQWSLACIAWECLTGDTLFCGDEIPSVLYRVVHEPLPALVPKGDDLSPQVEVVLARALSKNKADRFPSVVEFAAALEAALAAPVDPLHRSTPTPTPVLRDVRLNHVLANSDTSAEGPVVVPQGKALWPRLVLATAIGAALVGSLFVLPARPRPASRVEQASPPSPATVAASPALPPRLGTLVQPLPAATSDDRSPSGSRSEGDANRAPRARGVKKAPPRRSLAAAPAPAPVTKPSLAPARGVAQPASTSSAKNRQEEDRWRVD